MLKIKNSQKKNFYKKIFVKLCRLLGYEIIDQSNFNVPTSNKSLNQDLNLPGKTSITIPMGKVEIKRPVKGLTAILRTCASVNMLSQSKERIFNKEKSEYTLRSLNSIINSLNLAKNNFKEIKFKLIVIDHKSENKIVETIKTLMKKLNFDTSFIHLNTNEFEDKIKKINQQNKKVSPNQISNMSNIRKSLNLSKECDDLIYFVEDDYLHEKNTITEMIYTYEKISSLINQELILCPIDYPYLYNNLNPTQIFLGDKKHWRRVNETLCTFLTSKIIINKYWKQLTSMCEFEHYPFESPLHEIYKNEYCLSPIPSLAFHSTNVNSIYGLSPNFDWKKIWDESST
tara:strand:- start:137 stop:1165 length:1029 start_codon:yes stop_codon:yes gene_type:complete